MAGFDLTAALARERFRYDQQTGILYRRHTLAEKVGKAKSNGYLVVSAGGKNYQAHRVIWLITHGRWPAGDIDHINGIKTDNRLANLRDVSHKTNARNRMGSKRLRVAGPVPADDGKWVVVLPDHLGARTEGPFDTHAQAHDHFAAAMKWAEKSEGMPAPKLRPV